MDGKQWKKTVDCSNNRYLISKQHRGSFNLSLPTKRQFFFLELKNFGVYKATFRNGAHHHVTIGEACFQYNKLMVNNRTIINVYLFDYQEGVRGSHLSGRGRVGPL